MDGHRHGSGPEHDFEPVPGLPEPLPSGERMLWQGAPDTRVLALRVFHVRKVAIYFAVVGGLQIASALADGEGLREALGGLALLVSVALLAIGLLVLFAHLSARSTLYTITDRRVVMRVGIVLTMTFNLPFTRIASAGLRLHRDGSGDLPLELREASIGYAHLWPHARPWRLAKPEPMLRCVPDALRVGRLLADAWAQETGGTARPVNPAADPSGSRLRPDGQTALAGR
jgi:hypothetical protein